MSAQQVSLYYKDGSSDKVYHVQLEPKDGGYVVNFQYGKRGSTLCAGSKTKDPLALDKAQKIFDSLVKEKTAKGYTLGESGSVFQTPDLQDRVTGVVPQLLNNLKEELLEQYFDDDSWFMQEKFDGRRLLVKCVAGEVTAINKKGLAIPVLDNLAKLFIQAKRDICVDGELIGDSYHVFDLLELDGKSLRDLKAIERYEALSTVDFLQPLVVGTYFTSEQKRQAFEQIKSLEKEGVVFKKVDSLYVPGRPASGGNQLKYKFWESATVEVLGHHKSKRSIEVVVYRDGQQVSVGNVTVPTNYDMPALGSIVEVIYLYCHVKGALYQSKYKGIRDDQNKEDCAYSQLKLKAVVDDEEDDE